MKHLRAILPCLLLPLAVAAQVPAGLGFILTAQTGGVLRHTDKLTVTPHARIAGLEAGVVQQTFGRQPWSAWRGYPVLGAMLSWTDLGAAELGHALAAYPFIDLSLVDRPGWDLDFRLGCGIGWISKPYDRIDNPANNAVGTRFNAAIPLRFIASRPLGNGWSLQGGFSFTHYSNGAARLPNYGINIVAATAGIAWTQRPIRREELVPVEQPVAANRRWGLSAYSTVAWKEMATIGGPSFPVYAGSLAGMYQLNRINRLLLGAEYEFHEGLYALARLNWIYSDDAERRLAASRLAVFAGEEFLYGPLGICVQLGAYIGNIGVDKRFPVYSKLGLRWHLPPFPGQPGRLHVGAYLKAHLVTADYFGFGLGYTLE